jgi:hypothetical protein
MTRAAAALLALIAAAIASSAQATPSRQYILSADADAMMLMDVGTMTLDGAYPRAWMAQIKSHVGPDDFGAQNVLMEFNCAANAFRIRQSYAYDGAMNLMSSGQGGAAWDNAPPNSPSMEAMDVACQRRSPTGGEVLEISFEQAVQTYRRMIDSGYQFRR